MEVWRTEKAIKPYIWETSGETSDLTGLLFQILKKNDRRLKDGTSSTCTWI